MDQVWLTTLDNPYNPFTQFDEWDNCDQSHGYDTCALIDRVHGSSIQSMPPEINNILLEKSIDSIVQHFDHYIKVKQSDTRLFELLKKGLTDGQNKNIE